MTNHIQTDICIVGGGPAGLTLALELVKRDLDVVVIEQSKEYARTFRGESVSPDSVCILDRLGIFKKIQEHGLISTHNLEVIENSEKILDVNFEDFEYDYNYPIDLPQPVLLKALVEEASRYQGFQILRGTLCNELITEGNKITGTKCRTPEGTINISAHLTVGADGRFSRVRELAQCDYQKIPLERDFMWFKLPLPSHWDESTYRVKIVGGHHALFIPTYPDMLRVGFNIPKGSLQQVKKQGIQYLHEMIAELEPDLANSVKENVKSWSDTSVLDIFTTVVTKWYKDGLVLIGDAAHTLSPVLAQGVNHAIIDAVTLAPIVAKALEQKPNTLVSEDALKEFQALRENDIKVVRSMQLRQEKVFSAKSSLTTFLRRTVYRIINANDFLKSRIWTQVYYKYQASSDRKIEYVPTSNKKVEALSKSV